MPHSNASRLTSRDTARQHEIDHAPSLTIIVVSLGGRADIERAIRVLAPTAKSLGAEVIVVRRNAEASLDLTLGDALQLEVIRAPDDSSRADMLVLAMRSAKGDIVAVRDDTSLKDAQSLTGYYRAVASLRKAPPESPPSATSL